jgi:hypothetical protein
MADLQLNKWIAGIISACVIILQVINALQEAKILNVESEIKQSLATDHQQLTDIMQLLAIQKAANPSPSPSPSH